MHCLENLFIEINYFAYVDISMVTSSTDMLHPEQLNYCTYKNMVMLQSTDTSENVRSVTWHQGNDNKSFSNTFMCITTYVKQ